MARRFAAGSPASVEGITTYLTEGITTYLTVLLLERLREVLVASQNTSMSMLHYERQQEMRSVLPEYDPQSDWRGMRVGEDDHAKRFPSVAAR
jgi:hypothetical protein